MSDPEAPEDRQIAAELAERAHDIGVDPFVRIREHPRLSPEEKETTISFSKVDDQARIRSDELGIMRRLLAHREARVETLHVLVGDEIAAPTDPGEWSGELIVGVEVALPVGALQVQLSARASGSHAELVTDRVLSDVGRPFCVDASGGQRQ